MAGQTPLEFNTSKISDMALEYLRDHYGVIKVVDARIDFSSDCIQLVVVKAGGRKYLHPRFATRQEIMDHHGVPDFDYRIDSMMRGEPSTKRQTVNAPDFSLSELEEAERMVNECRSS